MFKNYSHNEKIKYHEERFKRNDIKENQKKYSDDFLYGSSIAGLTRGFATREKADKAVLDMVRKDKSRKGILNGYLSAINDIEQNQKK